MTMMSDKQSTSETTSRQQFTHGLQVLEGITSWHVWSTTLTVVLLLGAIILLSFPPLLAEMSRFYRADGSLLVRGFLGLMLAISGVTLYEQRRRLQVIRRGLVEQADAATKHRVRAEQLYGVSILDPLTGLYNRRFGETRLKEEIKKAELSGEPLLLLALDFDRFKEINDTYGHAAGDLALKEFSRRLQRAIRACDLAVRVGGDEFLAIFPDCPWEKMEQILSRMDSITFSFGEKTIPVSFSHGLAQYEFSDTLETMTRRADERLYAAKAERKSTVGS
jgi:diguanylate cyclase (GGDEF)-like protein